MATRRPPAGRSTRIDPGLPGASTSPLNERIARAVAAGVIVAATALLVHYVYANAPVMPLRDGWKWIQSALAFDRGGLTAVLRTTAFNHADQIYVLPSLIALAIGPWVDYSYRAFAFATLALLIALGAMFYRLARGEGLGPLLAAAVFVAVASMRHWINLLLGFQFGIFLSVISGALAIVVADRRRDRAGLVVAIALAAVSVASSSAGVLAAICVIFVRSTAHASQWRWAQAALLAIAVFALVEWIALRFGRLERTVFATTVLERLGDDAPGAFVSWLHLIGGALIGGRASLHVGVVVAAMSVLVLADALRGGRVDALAGLVLFSMLGTVAIALLRPPAEILSTRHEIMASPAIGACAIRLLAWQPHARALRAIAALVVAAGLIVVEADAYGDARRFAAAIADWDVDVRMYVAALAHGKQHVSPDEIRRVNPRATDAVRSWMQFARERRWTIFSPHYHGLESSDALPTRFADAARSVASAGVPLAFTGTGYVFNRYACAFASGCAIRESVELRATGAATIGIIVRGRDGAVLRNVAVAVGAPAAWIARSARTTLEPGESADAYVASPGPQVDVRSMSVVVVTRSSKPERATS